MIRTTISTLSCLHFKMRSSCENIWLHIRICRSFLFFLFLPLSYLEHSIKPESCCYCNLRIHWFNWSGRTCVVKWVLSRGIQGNWQLTLAQSRLIPGMWRLDFSFYFAFNGPFLIKQFWSDHVQPGQYVQHCFPPLTSIKDSWFITVISLTAWHVRANICLQSLSLWWDLSYVFNWCFHWYNGPSLSSCAFLLVSGHQATCNCDPYCFLTV